MTVAAATNVGLLLPHTQHAEKRRGSPLTMCLTVQPLVTTSDADVMNAVKDNENTLVNMPSGDLTQIASTTGLRLATGLDADVMRVLLLNQNHTLHGGKAASSIPTRFRTVHHLAINTITVDVMYALQQIGRNNERIGTRRKVANRHVCGPPDTPRSIRNGNGHKRP